MKIIRNNIIPFKGFLAINLFGVLFVRKDGKVDEVTINHESIHTEQMKELWYVFFYLFYLVEYMVRLVINRDTNKAYRAISFEQEAYDNEHNLSYLKSRKHYYWLGYII